MACPVFELKDVRFSYLGRYPALDGIDMTVEKGQNIAVIGANGSGKSTLLRILDALSFPASGSFKFRGREIVEESFADAGFAGDFRRSVGMVFQNPDVQLFCPTVREEIMFGPLHLGFDPEAVLETFDVITKVLGIGDLAERMPHQLSIGEKRKVAMASVLISGPDVLLLDEPTAGLDPKTTRDLVSLLNEYHKDGKTVITATHDMHIVGEIADTVYVFGHERKIVKSGSAGDILNDIGLLRANNLIHSHEHEHDGRVHSHPHGHPNHDHSH